ncbi:MAG: error-prone DNA polymerase [Betaproteobacteria bacterium]|nr:MAG: error-prone DNA polymerase [Betaproteobacteria bacterium]
MQTTYAELFARSNFSFQIGASHAEEMVRTAAQLGYRAIAIVDECSLAGVVRAHLEMLDINKAGGALQLIVGASFDVDGNTLILLAQTRRGYGDLSALITHARQRTQKGAYQIRLSDFDALRDCYAILIANNADSLSQKNEATPDVITIHQLLQHTWRLPRALGYSRLLTQSDATRFALSQQLASQYGVPIVAVGDVVMHDKSRKMLHDILCSVVHKKTVAQLGQLCDQNTERVLRPLKALTHLYPLELLIESTFIASQCPFSLDELRYEYPEEIVPPGHTPASYLREQTYLGATQRYVDGIPETASLLIEKELALIAELNYEPFFLTVYDIVKFARSQNILCQGRGSAANSAVCYCLHVTEVDPARMSMLFERFISKERNEPPDIDVDFEHQRREEVIQYIYKKYGRERAALCAAVSAYRTKGAIRDIGKALGFSLEQLDRISKNLTWWDKKADLDLRLAEIGFDPKLRRIKQLIENVHTIHGFPRHLSQHPGGFVIARERLDRLVPIENASMPDRTVIQWDKDDIDALGLMKVDVLGLGMLSCIRRALDLIGLQRNQAFRLQDIPAEDKAVYDMLCRGESTGVFQVESRAQMNMLPRLKPQNYFDLVVEVAIVRPGPIQGGMVHPYLKRRQGIEKVEYPSAAVKEVLKRTLGIPIFQEQVMQLAMVAAGFTAGEADQLRRAMAAWKRKGGLGHLEQKLTDGMLANGYSMDFARSIYAQIQGFGTYGFPESHAASFALLVYASAWIKHHHPAVFCCALLNSQPMGFYSPSQLTQDARRNGVNVLPIDINESQWESSVPFCNEALATLRLGFRLVSGLSQVAAERIVSARSDRTFTNLRDLMTRAALDQGDMKALANADALRSISGHRIATLWEASATAISDLPLADVPDDDEFITLNPLNENQDVIADYRSTGLTLRRHPLELLRPKLRGIHCASDLIKTPSGRHIRVAGLVTCRQRPGTASGVTFVTLEDETGNTNVVVWKALADVASERRSLVAARMLIVHGTLEHQGPITHLIAKHLEDASHLLGALSVSSHDFH